MQVCDYARSFVTFRIDMTKRQPVTVSQKPVFTVNNARIQLDSRCRITDRENKTREFVLSASCKGEQVNVPKGMWHDPNPDMCMIAAEEEFLIIKSWDRNNKGVKLYPPTLGDQPERQICKAAEALDGLQIHLELVEGRLLEQPVDVVQAA